MFFVMGIKWLYNCCFEKYCFQELLKTTLVVFFFSHHLVFLPAFRKSPSSYDLKSLLFHYIYIYIYIYMYVYICIFRQHFFVDANFIKHNKYFMSTNFLLDPFEFPYYFYRIRGELIYVLSIVVCIPSTYCPILGHHQGKIYYKSDVTFVLAYYYCVRASLPLKIMMFAFKCISIISVSS